jgi:hypothetical protein
MLASPVGRTLTKGLAIRTVKILVRRGWLRKIEASSKTNRTANMYELAMASPPPRSMPTTEA